MNEQIHKVLCSVDQNLQLIKDNIEADHHLMDATNVSVARNGTVQKLAERNPSRNEIWLHNKSDVKLFIGIDNGISKSRYSLTINPLDTLILSANNFQSIYKKTLYGFWDDNPETGTACMVTEFIHSVAS